MASNTASISGNTITDSTINNYLGCYLPPLKKRKLEKIQSCLPYIEVIGREDEVTKLEQLLKEHKRVVISGMGGLGKTSLAAHSARKYSSEFIEHIIFIDAETPNTIKSAFRSLGLHPDINITNFDKLELRAQIEQIYQVFGDTPTMVIFDNVTSYLTIKGYLPPKPKVNFYTLITAQLTEFESSFHIYHLPLLKEQSCMNLMENKFEGHWNSVKYQETELRELIVKMGSHSLAIIQAVAYIREKLRYEEAKKYTIQNYLIEFEINFNNIELPEYSEEEYKYRSVNTALSMNMMLLKNNKDHGDEAETALYSMAYLNPSRIKADMFLVLFSSDIRDAVIRALKRYSLINIVLDKLDSYITIHRLIQKVCQVKVDTYLKKGLILTISPLYIDYHWPFLEPHVKHFTLCDFNECYKELYNSGECRPRLEAALRAVGCDYSSVEGWTAAHYSAFECNEYMLRVLKERGQMFSELSCHGWTILHAACLLINVDYIRDLLLITKLKHTTLNQQTREKNTALHILMRSICYKRFCNNCEVAIKLVNAGCDTTLFNKDGDTVIELAAKYRHIPVLEHLLSLPGSNVIFNKHDSSVNKWAEENYIALFRQSSSHGGEMRVWCEVVLLERLGGLEQGVNLLKEELKGQNVSDEVCLDIVKIFDNIPSAFKIAAAYMLRKNIPADQFLDHLKTLPEDAVFNIIKESTFGYRCYNISKLLCNIIINLIEEHPLAFKIITFALCLDCQFNVDELHDLFYGKECLQNIREGVVLLENWYMFNSNHFTGYRESKVPDLVKPIVFQYSLEREELKATCAKVIKSQKPKFGKAPAVRYLGCNGVREAYMEEYGSDSGVIQSELDTRCGGERFLNVGDLSKWSALHWAGYFTQKSVISGLLLLGASINAEDDDKITPLHLAITKYGDIRPLIYNGALLTAATIQHSVTPLHIYALSKGLASFMSSPSDLLCTKVDMNVRLKDGRTPLHLAASQHNSLGDMHINWFIAGGADVDICDQEGNTPAHIAASAGRPTRVKLLRNHGADLNKANCVGETPLTILSAKNLSLNDI